ncbi:hypothetical protein [Nocardia sp. NPDC019395]|uniref:hypothetical protein n=1 Tax=Nocardia sp. NPDC019395 TaxID=3154686 RepID=UPI0033EA0340
MDLDRISTRAAELAASFEVRAPRVVAGEVPAWVTERLRCSGRKRQPVLTVGAGFEDLSATEQDGALANAIVVGDLVRTGQAKTALAFGLPFVAVGYPLIVVAVFQGIPVWAVVSVFAALYVCGHLLTFALRARRIIYRVDNRVAEVMGRPVVDVMIDHDIRNHPLLPGLARLFLAAYSPTVAQRVRRLDTTFGSHRIAG